MRLLDIRWLRANRHLRAAPFLAAARQLLDSQVELAIERATTASSAATASANASSTSSTVGADLRRSARPFQDALRASENCDDLIGAYRLLHRWIQQVPSQMEGAAVQTVRNRVLFGAYFTQAGLQCTVSALLARAAGCAADGAVDRAGGDDEESADVARICRRTDTVDADRISFGTVLGPCCAEDVVDTCMEDATAFAEEKFGYSPVIERVGARGGGGGGGGGGGARRGAGAAAGTQVEVVAPYLYFAVMETLKNSIVATVERHGALDVEDAPPIQVTVQSADQLRSQHAATRRGRSGRRAAAFSAASAAAPPPPVPQCRVSVFDAGTGLASPALRPRMWGFHFTTRPDNRREDAERVLDQWRDSRTHGSAIAGQGIGLPRARVMAGFNHAILAHEPRTAAAVAAFNTDHASSPPPPRGGCEPGAAPALPPLLHGHHRTCFRLDLLPL